METKHTQGKWVAVYSSAHTNTQTFEIRMDNPTFEEKEANAKLIESAPEMLGALIKAKHDIMNYISNKYSATNEKGAIAELNSDPTYQSILNAIKQATE